MLDCTKACEARLIGLLGTFDRFVIGKQAGVPLTHGVQRTRFEQTYRAVVQKMPVNIDAIISLDPNLGELQPLRMDLSRITFSINQTGKIVIDKQPPGTLSPNWADACMIEFSPQSRALDVWAGAGRKWHAGDREFTSLEMSKYSVEAFAKLFRSK
jgi:hypothetical protein